MPVLLIMACRTPAAPDANARNPGAAAISAAANNLTHGFAELRWRAGPALPEAMSNNAVAAVRTATGCIVASVGGLAAGRTRDDISSRGYASVVGGAGFAQLPDLSGFAQLPDLPGPPRLATSAVGLRGRLYVLGGYDVAADAEETSHPTMYSLDVADALDDDGVDWVQHADLPVAIDDAVAVSYQDRYLIVVSGWSTKAPVAAVQIYDVERASWTLGTPFPGTPVFGHTAAIVGDELVVLDGVAQTPRGYQLVHQAFAAKLTPGNPAELRWRDLGRHPGPARYRAAGGALEGTMLFVGGTADPYNYDGMSYQTKQPAAPIADDLLFDPNTQTFAMAPAQRPVATMDHRALASCGATVVVVGGMTAGPIVQPSSWHLTRTDTP